MTGGVEGVERERGRGRSGLYLDFTDAVHFAGGEP